MHGLFPSARRTGVGLCVAVLAALALTPMYFFVLDPALRQAMAEAADAGRMTLQFPDTFRRWAALTLWVAGFQVMFFHVGAMSLLARLTRRQGIAVALAVALRLFVSHRHFGDLGVADPYPVLTVVVGAAGTAAACLLFARSGIVPVMLFSVLLECRHLVSGTLAGGQDVASGM